MDRDESVQHFLAALIARRNGIEEGAADGWILELTPEEVNRLPRLCHRSLGSLLDEVPRLSILHADAAAYGRQVDGRLLNATAEHKLLLEGRDRLVLVGLRLRRLNPHLCCVLAVVVDLRHL